MNWKYEAIDKLKNYEARRRSLENTSEELERLETVYTGIRSASTDSTPGGNGNREDALLSNIIHRDELKRRFKESELWVSTTDRALSSLDEEERLVLDYFYIHRMKGNVDKLCEQLNVEKATVYRRRDSALRHFTIALYGIVESV